VALSIQPLAEEVLFCNESFRQLAISRKDSGDILSDALTIHPVLRGVQKRAIFIILNVACRKGPSSCCEC
jgi:hypothetical protein